eukprot:XP_001707941.1 Hypothetical protein GL50803_90560 [Giardia lamblia ATCC 50803]
MPGPKTPGQRGGLRAAPMVHRAEAGGSGSAAEGSRRPVVGPGPPSCPAIDDDAEAGIKGVVSRCLPGRCTPHARH